MLFIRKMIELLSTKERFYLYFIFIGLVLVAFVEMIGVASIMPFMAVVANPDVIESNRFFHYVYKFFNFADRQSFLIFLGIIVLVLLVASNLLKAFMLWATLKYDNQLNSNLGQRLLGGYLERSYDFFLNRNTADLGKNILNEARTVVASVLSPGMKIVSSSLVIIFILSFLFLVNPIIAVCIFALLGGTYFSIFYAVRKKLSRIGEDQVHVNSMKFKSAGEALGGIKDLKVLGREKYFLNVFNFYADRHAHNNVVAGTISQLPRYFLEIIAFGGILLLVLFYLRAEQSATQMVPLLALYAFAGYRLMPALQELFASATTLRYGLPALDVLHRDLIYERLDNKDLDSKGQDVVNPLSFSNSIRLNQVTYQYPQADSLALDDLDISIRSNTTVGLVGTTGSGKTTTVDIILGLLAPTSGDLLVDDVVVNSQNLVAWQLNLGYVPQHIYLIDDTLTRNIAFGVSDDEIDMEAVKRSAQMANLDEFVNEELSQGYDTVIGERGVRLSGGQRQRIGIARALYRNPLVLILDEATSALDGITEKYVMDAIKGLTGKITIIVIAHRLTTVKGCDMIYHLERGRLVDQGSYADLQKKSKWFNTAAKGL